MPGPRETELKLRIVAADAAAVVRRLAALTRVGGYYLHPQPDQVMHDVHLDTPDAALRSARVALRIRRVGGLTWLTLKGPSHALPGGLLERVELEARWSSDALARIRRHLRALGIETRDPAVSRRRRAVDVVRAAGLDVIQTRDTHRIVRDVTRGEDAAVPVAELAVDTVTYRLPGVDVRHHEVELEGRGGGGPAAISDLADALLGVFGPTLHRWTVEKIALGSVLEQLRLDGDLAEALGGRGTLTEAAYARIIRRVGA